MPERTPLNSDGDFYVEKDICLLCTAPEHEAPELISTDLELGCYFKRQPETSDDINRALNAMWASCVAALRYAGNDSTIIAKLRERGCSSQIDVDEG